MESNVVIAAFAIDPSRTNVFRWYDALFASLFDQFTLSNSISSISWIVAMKASDSLNARYVRLTISCFEISFLTMFVLDTIPETIFSYGRWDVKLLWSSSLRSCISRSTQNYLNRSLRRWLLSFKIIGNKRSAVFASSTRMTHIGKISSDVHTFTYTRS